MITNVCNTKENQGERIYNWWKGFDVKLFYQHTMLMHISYIHRSWCCWPCPHLLLLHRSFSYIANSSCTYSENAAHRPRTPATSGPTILTVLCVFHCLSIFCTFVLSYSSALKGESSKGSKSSTGVIAGLSCPGTLSKPLSALCVSDGLDSG